MTGKIISQILAISATGRTNMFDMQQVKKIALEMGYMELFFYLPANKKEYTEFILYGKRKHTTEKG